MRGQEKVGSNVTGRDVKESEFMRTEGGESKVREIGWFLIFTKWPRQGSSRGGGKKVCDQSDTRSPSCCELLNYPYNRACPAEKLKAL